MQVLEVSDDLLCYVVASRSPPWPPLPRLMVSVVVLEPPPLPLPPPPLPPATTRFVAKLAVGEVAPVAACIPLRALSQMHKV